ncbi:MAG: glycoside hydrolase [Actinomycetota bacterium]|nr:glycoside hydrolase [Actinomycetota bacterium]
MVDAADAQHMIASSNDYGTCCDQYYTTFDGGATWSTGNMSVEDSSRTGSDPVTTIDVKHDVALHSSLNYTFNDNGEACDGDVVVSPSKDGGLSWKKPVVVYSGQGCDLDATQIFNDKEWITTDNNRHSKFYGRTYVTWSAFVAHNGAYASSAIWESHSDDGGHDWSKAQEISGSNPAICTFQEDGPAGVCDENQFSVPAVAPDGTVYVVFENGQNTALWETGEVLDDQYLLVKSTDGGKHWSKPSFIVGLEDGSNDYPLNDNGRQTLTGYQVRVDSAGNIVVGKDGKLYLVFSDNRNGVHDSPSPVTNVDTFVMSSPNGGSTWTTPVVVDAGGGDQWFPWVDVDPLTGKIGVIYHDRGASNGPTYNTSLAEGTPGSLVKTVLNTAPSNPTMSEFFQAGIPTCEFCALFHGDYISVAYGKDGHANGVWTDMGDPSPFTPGLFLQFIYFTRK